MLFYALNVDIIMIFPSLKHRYRLATYTDFINIYIQNFFQKVWQITVSFSVKILVKYRLLMLSRMLMGFLYIYFACTDPLLKIHNVIDTDNIWV